MTEGLYKGDCLDMMRAMEPESVDAIITDPPYGLSFMGKDWDHGVPGVEFWREALRVAKPGAHLCAFGGTRTYHRLACAIEDAGWEVRDCLALLWVQCAGFPKSLDVSKAIDKEAGAEREVLYEGKPVKRMIPGADQDKTGSWIKDSGREFVPTETAPATDLAREWSGWGTALKPAYEPIILARKPLCGTVARNVREHGTGALNIDACRIAPAAGDYDHPGNDASPDESHIFGDGWPDRSQKPPHTPGRYPANLLLQHAPGCRKVGVRKVASSPGGAKQREKTSRGLQGGGFGQERSDMREYTEDVTKPGYADADGMETVAVWECVPGCPVAALDEMSGVSKSTDAADLSPSSDGRFGVGAANPPHYRKAKRVGGFADTGGASRFFTCFEPEVPFLYCPKASRAEREAGCDGLDSTELVCNNETVPLDEGERFIWEDAGLKQAILAGKGTSQARGIIGSLFGTRSDALADLLWHMCSSGRRPTGRFLQALCYTTATATSSTTDSPILSALQRWTTSECTQGANSETESGGRGVASAESSSRSGASAGTSPDRDGLCTDGADNATSPASFATSVLAKLEAESVRKPAHCTVKPLAVIEWLLKLATREGALVLDPFLGSGTTAVACIRLGRRWAGAEITEEYWPIIEARVAHAERTRQPELFGGEVC